MISVWVPSLNRFSVSLYFLSKGFERNVIVLIRARIHSSKSDYLERRIEGIMVESFEREIKHSNRRFGRDNKASKFHKNYEEV